MPVDNAPFPTDSQTETVLQSAERQHLRDLRTYCSIQIVEMQSIMDNIETDRSHYFYCEGRREACIDIYNGIETKLAEWDT